MRGHRQFAEFVEKECASVGLFEFAHLIGGSAGETALAVTKKDAFRQVFGNCSAVQGHKPVRRPAAHAVNELRD